MNHHQQKKLERISMILHAEHQLHEHGIGFRKYNNDLLFILNTNPVIHFHPTTGVWFYYTNNKMDKVRTHLGINSLLSHINSCRTNNVDLNKGELKIEKTLRDVYGSITMIVEQAFIVHEEIIYKKIKEKYPNLYPFKVKRGGGYDCDNLEFIAMGFIKNGFVISLQHIKNKTIVEFFLPYDVMDLSRDEIRNYLNKPHDKRIGLIVT